MVSAMQVQVTLYGILREYAPPGAVGTPVALEVPENATVADLLEVLHVPSRARLLVLVAGVRSSLAAQLAPGAQVTLAPMVGGG
jgi:hypothetical protein